MKKWIFVALVAAFALACSDDTVNSNNGTNNGVNNGTNNGANNGSNNGVNNGANNGTNNGDIDMGGDVDMGGDIDMGEDTDMGNTVIPVTFTWPNTPADFVSSATQTSYINSMVIPSIDSQKVPACCKDFGAISKKEGTDNAIAVLASDLAAVAGDLQANLDDSLQSGSFVVLLDHRELDGPNDADNFLLSWLTGSFATGTTYSTASTGSGQFNADIDAFMTNSGEPQVVFNPAIMNNSQMSAGPETVTIVVPLGITSLQVPIAEAEVTATASITLDGISYSQGTISGYIQLSDLYDALNAVVDTGCSCLGLSGDLFVEGSQGYEGDCIADARNRCPNEQLCYTLAGSNLFGGEVCGALPALLNASADIDADMDQDYEALSAGFTWEATTAELVGAN